MGLCGGGGMIARYQKQVKTRKPHTCECGKIIPVGTICTWYKAVAFHDSDVGRNEWLEGYICPDCEKELEEPCKTKN